MWKKFVIVLILSMLGVNTYCQIRLATEITLGTTVSLSKELAIATTAPDAGLAVIKVGQVVAKDPDCCQTLTFKLTGGDTKPFSISPLSGILSMRKTFYNSIKSEAKYIVVCTVYDNGIPILSSSAEITILVKKKVMLSDQGIEVPSEDCGVVYVR